MSRSSNAVGSYLCSRQALTIMVPARFVGSCFGVRVVNGRALARKGRVAREGLVDGIPAEQRSPRVVLGLELRRGGGWERPRCWERPKESRKLEESARKVERVMLCEVACAPCWVWESVSKSQ